MAWEVHAAIQDERAVNLISTQVDGKKIELPAILSDKPFKNMGGKCTPSAWRQCPDQAMQSPARRGNKETEDQLANKFTRRRAQLQIEKAGGSLGDVAPKETKPSPPPAEATSKSRASPSRGSRSRTRRPARSTTATRRRARRSGRGRSSTDA